MLVTYILCTPGRIDNLMHFTDGIFKDEAENIIESDVIDKMKFCQLFPEKIRDDVVLAFNLKYVGRFLFEPKYDAKYEITFDDGVFEERFYEAFVYYTTMKLERMIKVNGDRQLPLKVDLMGLSKYISENIYYLFDFKHRKLDVDDDYLFNLAREYIKDVSLMSLMPYMNIDDFLYEIVEQGGKL